MSFVVAVIAPGMMGAAVGGRLAAHGLKVLTSLDRPQRSRPWSARKAAGISAASDEEIAATDFILSILPPGDAVSLAQRFAPALTASNSKPVYGGLQRRQPEDHRARRGGARSDRIAVRGCRHHRLAAAHRRKDSGPRFYASGPQASRFAALKDYGLDVRVLGGPLSAASAMKMSYAGITKGTQALGCGDDAGSDPGRIGRCPVRRIEIEPAADPCLAQAQPRAHAAEGLSLDRGDARDRRFRRRGSGRRTSSMSARRISTSRSRAISRPTRKTFPRSKRFSSKAAPK